MTTFVMDDTPIINNGVGSTNGISEEEKAKRAVVRKALEAQIIEKVDAQQVESVVGFVSGYIDLGLQPRGDYAEVYDENDPKHKEKLTNGSFLDKRFDNDSKQEREMLCTPQKPAYGLTFSVDFPDFMIDYGEGIGVKPYRMVMGGETWETNAEGRNVPVVQHILYKTENKNNAKGVYAVGQTTTLHKMAAAARVLNEDGLFKVGDLPKIFNKPMMFDIQVWNKPSKKDPSKAWFTETIKFKGVVPKAMLKTIPEWDGSLFWGVNLGKENDKVCRDQLRYSLKNTIKRAENWEGSVLKEELDADWEAFKASNDASKSDGGKGGNTSTSSKPDTTTTTTLEKPKESSGGNAGDKAAYGTIKADDDFEDDIPDNLF